MSKRVYEIDGNAFDDLEGFYGEFKRSLGTTYGGNLDSFNDVLRGGFGTPDEGFLFRWLHSDRSRRILGHPETIRWLETKLQRSHPSNHSSLLTDIERARRGEGQTLFDMIVEIIEVHGAGGDEADDGVDLELK